MRGLPDRHVAGHWRTGNWKAARKSVSVLGMAPSLSILSLLAAGFYLLVSLACLAAARSQARQARSKRMAAEWALVAVFFLLLAVSRVFLIEDSAELLLREFLHRSQGYENRRPVQMMLTVAIVIIGFMTILLFGNSLSRIIRQQDQDRMLLKLVYLACFVMVLLIGARVVSLHAMDAVLYGPLKINYFVDIGSSLAVLICASIQLVRRSGSRPDGRAALAASRKNGVPVAMRRPPTRR